MANVFENRILNYGTKAADQFEANPHNWRTHPQKQRDAVQASLRELGWIGVVVENRTTGRLIDGHERVWQALKNNEQVPYIEVELSEEEERLALTIFDPITYMAETDSVLLDALLREVNTSEDALQELLASMAEEAGLYQDEKKNADAEPQIDRAEELRVKWGVCPGQLWQLGEHRLMCGDCTDAAVVACVMDGDVVDTVLTDPPYGIEFDTDYTKLHGGNFGTQKRNKHAPVQGDDKDFDPSHLLGFKNVVLWGANCYPQHLKVGTFLVWDKRNAAGQTLFSDAEVGWLNKGHGCYIFAHKWDGLNRETERGEHLHPTQKPIALWSWVMSEHVKDADIVFDPYSGVGGVLLACEQLGRKCRAVEISPGYVAVALQRYADATGKTPVLVE